MEELKPCPFCESKARVAYESPITNEETTGCTNLRCPLFHISFSVDEWNHRPREAELEAEIARMKEAVPVEFLGRPITYWIELDNYAKGLAPNIPFKV